MAGHHPHPRHSPHLNLCLPTWHPAASSASRSTPAGTALTQHNRAYLLLPKQRCTAEKLNLSLSSQAAKDPFYMMLLLDERQSSDLQ